MSALLKDLRPGPAGASRSGSAPGRPARLLGAACAAAVVVAGASAMGATAASPPAQTLVVSNLGDSGPGSLRAAIEEADAGPPGARTVVDFAVHGTVVLAGALPSVQREVAIDGESAPTHVAGGPPVVEIDCHGHAGLRFAAGSAGSALLGVSVGGASGAGVRLEAGSITVNGDYIGLDLAGRALPNHGDGVLAAASSARDLIGLNSSGVSGAVANVVSGNTGNGIVLSGSSGDTVAANRIGTDPAGTSAVPNGGDGLLITRGARGDEVGGTEYVDSATGRANNPTGDKGAKPPVFVVPPLGNLISGNAGSGVLIDGDSRGNVLNGNFIGTTASGDAALGNAGNGVWIDHANDNTLKGCRFVNNPFVYYNVVSGNGKNGLRVTDSDNTLVQGNFFGVGADNSVVVANRRDGVRVDGTSARAHVGGVIPLGNVVSGNGRNGIEVTDRATGFVTFNTFGGLFAFKGAAPNRRDGLLITSTGGDNLARTNVFSGNAGNGIELAGQASRVTIDPDIAGLTTNGRAALPNGRDGVLIDGSAHGNTVGGARRSVIPQNTFSGNAGYGIAITGRAHGNRVFGSFVGTKIFGLAALANRRGGVLLGGGAYRNTIGWTGSRSPNLISGNSGNGVTLLRRTRRNRVVGNVIGRNRIGRPLPNSGFAVLDLGAGNTVAGNLYPPLVTGR